VRNGYGEGRVLSAKQSLYANLVDRVATLDDVLAELTGGKGAKTSRRAAAVQQLAASIPVLPSTRDEIAAVSHLLGLAIRPPECCTHRDR
jgi:ClpP class serine protease